VRKTGLITAIVGGLLLFISTNVLAKQFNVLLFTKTAGWHHKSTNAAVSAMQKIADIHHFSIDWQENADLINDENLARFDAIVFLMTTGDILNEKQQQAMEKFIQSGKGFVGIHSAADTEYDWPWYAKMVGHQFVIHPVIQTARMTVINRQFPGLEYFPDTALVTDEWYEFGPKLSPDLTYLMTIDETTYDPVADWGRVKGDGMGDFHPVAWYQSYDGGRAFYTALGHMPESYTNRAFLEHIYGGLYWAATGKGIVTK
jgi:type 1 glutamine amidotransferase